MSLNTELPSRKERLSKKEYFALLAHLVAQRSTCLRRQVGAVIVDRDWRIVSTGFNGAPAGVKHCLDMGCPRKNFPSGQMLHLCLATHAEANAIANAARQGHRVNGARIFCSILPCQECLKLLINAGIKEVYYLGKYSLAARALYQRLVDESGIRLEELSLKV